MRLLPRVTREAVGQPAGWWPLATDTGRSAMLRCPVCREPASLDGHMIGANGKVDPSVQCPHEGCTFHEFVQLEGWVTLP